MKKTITSILFLISFFLQLGFKQVTDDNQKLIANVSKFKNTKGQCYACLYDKADGFPSKNAFKCIGVKITGETTKVVFDNLPQGTYALAVFHDENNNNTFDVNFLGIPKEGSGASNNNLPKMSAPTFEANKFTIGNNSKTLNITLRY